MIIQILLKNIFPLILNRWSPEHGWPLIFNFLKDLHTNNPLVANKYTKIWNGVEWGWIMPHGLFCIFPYGISKENDINSGQVHNIWKQQQQLSNEGLFIQIG